VVFLEGTRFYAKVRSLQKEPFERERTREQEREREEREREKEREKRERFF